MSPAVSKESEGKDESKLTKSEKRKKTDSSTLEKAPVAKQVKAEPVTDTYDEILKLEKDESATRSASRDHEHWKEICGELRTFMKEIFEMKIKKSAASDISEKRIQASLLFVTLKKLNRLEKLRIKNCRDATFLSKQGVDSFNLQLQNLLYEVLHLKKEVTKCVNFKSADAELELVPVEQFQSEAPAALTSAPQDEDGHAVRLARLQWELARRVELSEEAAGREAERDKLERGISSKEGKLRELGPQLAGILASTLPVQQLLELPLTDKRNQAALARQLPRPLIALYTGLQELGEQDAGLRVRVVGDETAAKAFQAKEEAEAEEDEEGGEDRSQDEGEPGEKLHRSKSRKEEVDLTSRLLATHPLQAQLRVDSLTLTFYWLPALSLVTVEVKLEGKEGGVTGKDRLLSHLLDQADSGEKSPSPDTAVLLQAAGLPPVWPLPGKLPYRWVQHLAGLQFPAEGGVEDGTAGMVTPPAENGGGAAVGVVVAAIKARLTGRLGLQAELDKLQKKDVVGGGTDLPSTRAISVLKSWQATDWESYQAAGHTTHLVQAGVVGDHCFLYKAVVSRAPATLTAMVSVPPDYPATAPTFCLSLKLAAGEKKKDKDKDVEKESELAETVETSEWVRDLEREVNLAGESGAAAGSGLLTAMTARLLILTDVLLEASSGLQEDKPPAFAKSQAFLSGAVRGRMRRLPLSYSTSQQMFQQR